MGLKDIKNYFESKSKEKNTTKQEPVDIDYGFREETIEYNGKQFIINTDKMSEDYFEPIYHNGHLMEIIAVVKPCKPNHRVYRHYRNFDDYIVDKHYAQDFVSKFTRDMGDVIVNHTHTRTSIQHNETDEVTGDERLNITRETVKHEAEHIVTYQGNKYILTNTIYKLNFYPENTVFGFTHNMDKYAECIIENTQHELKDNFSKIYSEEFIQTTHQGRKNPYTTTNSVGNKKLYLDISHFVEKTIEYQNHQDAINKEKSEMAD